MRYRSVARGVGSAALLVLLLQPIAALPPAAIAQGTLSQLQTDVDQIARHARPAVVTVLSRRTLTHGTGRTGRPRVQTRVGSGVAISDSEILTTASVVLHGERLSIRTANGLESKATVLGVDPIYNVALLRVTEVRLPPVRFADGAPPSVGDWILTLGTSFRAQPTQSVGNVAYLHREPRFLRLQISNTSYPGNSGGPAFNARGELVGIVQGALGWTSDSYGGRSAPSREGATSFILSVEDIRPIIDELRRDGRVRYGFFGVSTRGASVDALSEAGGVVPIGALVEAVTPGGPAQKLGLREGDLIVAFDRERVEFPEQLARWVAATRPGQTVEVVWVRDETQQVGRVAVAESPVETPLWALGPSPIPDAPDVSDRIDAIQRQIESLNRELSRLKTATQPGTANP